MNLQPMNPPARDGQLVLCAKCYRMTGAPLADLDAPAGTFYCRECAYPAPSIPDHVADTARALAEKWRAADMARAAAMGRFYALNPTAEESYLSQLEAIEDAARACGPQVLAAFRALVTGDAGREVSRG